MSSIIKTIDSYFADIPGVKPQEVRAKRLNAAQKKADNR